MATAIKMPRQGNTVESCIISEWHKKEGDRVNVGDVLFTYETDKATFDEESTVEGVLLKALYEEDDEVAVLEDVCFIGEEGEDILDLVGSTEEPTETNEIIEESKPAEVKEENTNETTIVSTTVSADASKISPRAKKRAEKEGLNPNFASATGPKGRIIEQDIIELSKNGQHATKAAYQAYTDSNKSYDATGLNGKVTLDDLSKKPIAQTAQPVSEEAIAYRDVKIPNIRKVIAKAMHASLSNTAQLTLNSSFDASDILAYRKQIKANMESLSLANITLNDIVLYAVAKTLKNHEDLNAHFLDDKMRYFNDVHLGIAVDTDRGLLVPTLFNSNHMTLSDLSSNAKSIIKEAQSGTISPDYLTGATFTITNLGSLGVESFTPVLNAPQTGILGVDTITYRAKKASDGSITHYPAMGLSLTFDHRAIDGAPAARFLKELVSNLENFTLLLAK